ncbi:hypothetical protein NSTC731_06323 [Nostoc sp. DSM 114167]|jgi:hypothetical protein
MTSALSQRQIFTPTYLYQFTKNMILDANHQTYANSHFLNFEYFDSLLYERLRQRLRSGQDAQYKFRIWNLELLLVPLLKPDFAHLSQQ